MLKREGIIACLKPTRCLPRGPSVLSNLYGVKPIRCLYQTAMLFPSVFLNACAQVSTCFYILGVRLFSDQS